MSRTKVACAYSSSYMYLVFSATQGALKYIIVNVVVGDFIRVPISPKVFILGK